MAESPAKKEKSFDRASFQSGVMDRLKDLPLWLLFILLAGVLIVYNVNVNPNYSAAFNNIAVGIVLTIQITITAYLFAITIGLFTALGQLSENILVRNLAQLYVQIIRGVPIIVQIFYVALVLVPAAITLINNLGIQLAEWGLLATDNSLAAMSVRDVSLVMRGIIALSISYGAFSSEIFRAGIQSIEKGQIEAGQALGLSWFQSFRHIILPQALRRVLPPLGNDFIAMLKESSLVSVIGVNEITQLGKKYSSASFQFAETYNTLAYLYLSMTLILSIFVRQLERKMKTDQRK